MKLFITILTILVTISGCSTTPEKVTKTCSDGRTNLDGTCVNQEIADYVSCVRAQGTQFGTQKSHSISADVGYFGINASAAKEVSEKLEKKYTASDQTMLAIVNQCNKISGIVSTTTSPATPIKKDLKPSSNINISGNWSYSSGRGEARIVENGDNSVTIYMNYKPNRAPRPHYEVKLTRNDQILEGTWICLIKGLRGCGVTNNLTFKIDPSGRSISVLNSDDPYKHGFTNGFTLYKM